MGLTSFVFKHLLEILINKFISGKEPPYPLIRRFNGPPQASLGISEKRKISCPCQDSNPGSSSL
jgi:hypothetical protein